MEKVLDFVKSPDYFNLAYNADNLKAISMHLEYLDNNNMEYIIIKQSSLKRFGIIFKNDDDIILKLLEYNKNVALNIKIEIFYDRLKDKSKLSDEIIIQSIEQFKNNEEKYLAYCYIGVERGLSSALYHLGLYYEKKGDFVKSILYFNKSIEKGNYKAAYYLGNSYKQNKDIDNMLKYYLIAVEKNVQEVKIELARYYQEQNDSEKQLKYLLESKIDDMTLEELLLVAKSFAENNNKRYDYYEKAALKNHVDSAYLMAQRYKATSQKSLMEKMYLIAIEQGDTKSLHELIDYRIKDGPLNISDPINIKAAESGYEPAFYNIAYNIYTNYCNNGHKNNLDKMEKYFIESIKKGNQNAMNHLCQYYLRTNNYDSYYKICLSYPDKIDKSQFIKIMDTFMNDKGGKEIPQSCIEILQQIDLTGINNVPTSIRMLKKLITDQLELIDMHFKYAPTGEGYEEAKKDFMKKLQ